MGRLSNLFLEAEELLEAGVSHEKIADVLGISTEMVHEYADQLEKENLYRETEWSLVSIGDDLDNFNYFGEADASF